MPTAKTSGVKIVLPIFVLLSAAILTTMVLRRRSKHRISIRQTLLAEAQDAGEELETFAEREYGSLGTTTDEIFSQEDNKILPGLNYRIGQKEIGRITQPERRLLAVYSLWGEVHNGGFGQYFFNSIGDEFEFALAGLKEMGAPGAAALLQRTISVFPGGKPPADRSQRVNTLTAVRKNFKTVWDQCDKEFYALNEDLNDLMLSYAKQKRGQIVLP